MRGASVSPCRKRGSVERRVVGRTFAPDIDGNRCALPDRCSVDRNRSPCHREAVRHRGQADEKPVDEPGVRAQRRRHRHPWRLRDRAFALRRFRRGLRDRALALRRFRGWLRDRAFALRQFRRQFLLCHGRWFVGSNAIDAAVWSRQAAAHQEKPAGQRGGLPGRSQREDARRCGVSRRPGSKSLQRWRSSPAHRALASPTSIRITSNGRTVPGVVRHLLLADARCHLPRSPPCDSLLSF